MVEADGAGFGDRGSGRGARRELRTDPTGQNGGGSRRDDHRGVQPGRNGSVSRQPDVCEEPDAFLLNLTKEGQVQLNLQDEIIRETLLTHGGEIVNAKCESFSSCRLCKGRTSGRSGLMKLDFLTGLYVFMLAAFIGFEVIRRVSPLLHTPLMSLTNALDAIAVVGAIILAGEGKSTLATILGTIAIVAATSNIVGGFIITDRMLKMFKASGPRKS